MLTGGCYCGAIRYEGTGIPSHLTNCHCSICRRTSGAPYIAWFSLKPEQFRFTRGTPALFRSSAHGMRSFCPVCGTQLTFASTEDVNWVDITLCSLDDPESLTPDDHIFVSTKLKWVHLQDSERQHNGSRPEQSIMGDQA